MKRITRKGNEMAELQAKYDALLKRNIELLNENIELHKEVDKLQSTIYAMDAEFDTLQDQVAEYIDDLKWKAETVHEEMESKDAYIEELEETLYGKDFDAAYEEDAIDAVFRVADEVLVLNAPVVEEEVVEEKPQRRNSRAKAVVCITTGLIFESIKEAAEYYGIKTSNSISKCCNGKQKSAGKYNGQKLIWQFAM